MKTFKKLALAFILGISATIPLEARNTQPYSAFGSSQPGILLHEAFASIGLLTRTAGNALGKTLETTCNYLGPWFSPHTNTYVAQFTNFITSKTATLTQTYPHLAGGAALAGLAKNWPLQTGGLVCAVTACKYAIRTVATVQENRRLAQIKAQKAQEHAARKALLEKHIQQQAYAIQQQEADRAYRILLEQNREKARTATSEFPGFFSVDDLIKNGIMPPIVDGKLDLSGLRLNFLTGLTLQNIPALSTVTEINLSNNGLSYLDENVFNECTALQELNLSNNNLLMLANNHFAALKKLKKLTLTGNPLGVIQPDAFAGLTMLLELTITPSALDEFNPQRLSRPIEKLREISPFVQVTFVP